MENRFKIAWLLVLTIMITLVSWSDEDQDLNRESPYLINSYSARKGKDGLLSLKFYGNKELKGEPIMVLDKEGLSIKGKLECKWNVGYPSSPMLKQIHDNPFSDKPCPRRGPIVSGADAPVIVEVKDNLSADYYETTKYEDKVLYISKKETEAFEYRDSESSVRDREIAANKAAYEELRKSDKSLVKFLDKWNKCVEKKDEKCLPKRTNEASFVDLWLDYSCYTIPGFSTKLFRDKWLNYRCHLSRELYHKGNCDREKVSKVKPEISITTRYEVNEIIWNAMEACFSTPNLEKNTVSVVEGRNGISLTIRTYGKRSFDCKIYKKKEENEKKSWMLEGVSDVTDEMIEGGVFEIF